MKRKLTSFAAAGALLLAGAGFSAAQAQGTWAAAPPLYDTYGYDYGWGPGPLGAVIAAPAVLAAGVLGAAATIATAPFAAAATLGAAPYAAGYYADPYYDAGYYGAGYAPVGWGYNYGPTYVAYRNGPAIRRAAIVTRGPYRAVRVVTPARSFRARPVHIRHINAAPVRMHRVEAQPARIASVR